jgi:hypothetical protein
MPGDKIIYDKDAGKSGYGENCEKYFTKNEKKHLTV